jgi:hypothetical protein
MGGQMPSIGNYYTCVLILMTNEQKRRAVLMSTVPVVLLPQSAITTVQQYNTGTTG